MEKFKSFVFGLLTNRLGIILATLNLCLLASKYFVHHAFTHQHGADCVFFKNFFFIPATAVGGPDNSLLAVNVPAIVLAQFPSYYTRIFTSDFCVYSQLKFNIFFLAFFITFQWLFIGWLTKTLARILRKNYLNQD